MSRIFTISGKPYVSPDKIGFGRRQRIQEQHLSLFRKDCPNNEPFSPSQITTSEGSALSHYAVWMLYGGGASSAEYSLIILRGVLKPFGDAPSPDSPEFEELFLDASDEEVNAVADFFFGTEESKTNVPPASNETSTIVASPPITENSLTTTQEGSSSTALTAGEVLPSISRDTSQQNTTVGSLYLMPPAQAAK